MRWLLALLLLAAPAAAQEAAGVGLLTGTLRQVRDARAITLGYREASLPFSFRDSRGQPAGYAIDLCLGVVEEAALELGLPQLAVAWRPVTPETRIAAVAEGAIDLECGSTTANAERRRQVAFSPVTFIAATRLLVRRDGPQRALRDLKSLVVTAGTTNEAAVRALAARQRLPLRIVTMPDHAQSYAALLAGEVEGLASDDVLLHGWVAANAEGSGFRVTAEALSYEPYGLMFRRDDPAFAATVFRAFARMAEERRLTQLYERWFRWRLPNGQRLNIPMSRELAEIFRALGEPD